MKQVLQKFEESNKRLQEDLTSANTIMSNLYDAMQQSVGILGQLLTPRNQIKLYLLNQIGKLRLVNYY